MIYIYKIFTNSVITLCCGLKQLTARKIGPLVQ